MPMSPQTLSPNMCCGCIEVEVEVEREKKEGWREGWRETRVRDILRTTTDSLHPRPHHPSHCLTAAAFTLRRRRRYLLRTDKKTPRTRPDRHERTHELKGHPSARSKPRLFLPNTKNCIALAIPSLEFALVTGLDSVVRYLAKHHSHRRPNYRQVFLVGALSRLQHHIVSPNPTSSSLNHNDRPDSRAFPLSTTLRSPHPLLSPALLTQCTHHKTSILSLNPQRRGR
ncbi:hypothetical protein LZ31DRAFT_546572 [Colletotrichum somersetense]|nr:hypothetical protein LZ31DRAFT_546572 [Colletotrichum somersetense]